MRRRLLLQLFLLLLGAVAFPHAARADAGTPLMWATMLHLAIGNALIGVGEGLLLAWLFSVSKGKACALMIPANYFSAWGGQFWLGSSIVHAVPLDLNNAWKWFWIMVAVTYVMTLIFEWPFVAWCFRGRQGWLGSSIRASLVVQSASYVLLFGWYWLASWTSLYTRMKIVVPRDLALPDSLIVYFISPTDGDVYKQRCAGGEKEKVYHLQSADPNDRLYVRANEHHPGQCDLMARLGPEDANSPRVVTIETDLSVDGALDWLATRTDPPRNAGTWMNFGQVPRLQPAKDSPWEFFAGFWPVEGLHASNKATGDRVKFAYETPFGAWIVRNAVQVAPHAVVFQLGTDQICAFDPTTHQVALLWHGRGLVPVLPLTDGNPAN